MHSVQSFPPIPPQMLGFECIVEGSYMGLPPSLTLHALIFLSPLLLPVLVFLFPQAGVSQKVTDSGPCSFWLLLLDPIK